MSGGCLGRDGCLASHICPDPYRTAPGENHSANCGPGVASMCGCRSVSRDKRPALEGDVNSGVAVPVWGKGCAADLSSTMNLKLP